MPKFGDELHHFGWNACSSPFARTPRIRTSSAATWLSLAALVSHSHYRHEAQSRKPKIVKVIEPEKSSRALIIRVRTRFTAGRKHLRQRALGRPMVTVRAHLHARLRNVRDSGPVGKWNRGPQFLHYDLVAFGFDTLLSSEWGTPNMIESGLQRTCFWPANTAIRCTFGICADDAISRRSIWEKSSRCLEMRPAHNPTKAYGLLEWSFRSRIYPHPSGSGIEPMVRGSKKVIEIPAEPADPSKLPPCSRILKQCRHWYRTLICRWMTNF